MSSRIDHSRARGRDVERPQRANELPRLVTVDLGNREADATALAVRVGAQGHQTLVIMDGTLTWLASHRVAARVGAERRGDHSTWNRATQE